MSDVLEYDKMPEFMQNMEIDVEETVYINGIPEKEYYSMTVDVSDPAKENDQEEEEEAFEFLSEKEAGQFVKIGGGLVPGDQQENQEEKKKEEKKPKPKQDLVDQALIIDIDGGERNQYETFGWLGRLKSTCVSKGAKVDIKERDLGRDNEKKALDEAEKEPKVNEEKEKAKVNEEQPKVNEEQPKVNEEQQKALNEQKLEEKKLEEQKPEEKKEEKLEEKKEEKLEEKKEEKLEEKKEEKEEEKEEKKEEVPDKLMDYAPEDDELIEQLLEFRKNKRKQPYTFAVLDGPDRKAVGKEEPEFPQDVERPVIELHASILNTELSDYVSMYEAKQNDLISKKKVTKYVPVFGHSFIVFRYSCFDEEQKKYMRYHLSLGFAMKNSIKQIVEKGLDPKGNYTGSLQSAEGLATDMSKAYRTTYTKLDKALEKVESYAELSYRLLDRNANSFVKEIAEEAGVSEEEALPDANQAKPFDTSGLIFENLGTVIGQEYKPGEKPEKKGKKGKKGAKQDEQQQNPEEGQQEQQNERPAGVAGLSVKMMKGFGDVTRGHNLPIDVLRMIAGVERLGEVEQEDDFILEGLPDVEANEKGLLEEVPKRGNLDFELLELEDRTKKLRGKNDLDELEDQIYDLDDMEIIPANKEKKKGSKKKSKINEPKPIMMIDLLDDNKSEIDEDENIIPIKKELPKVESKKSKTSKIFEFFGFGKPGKKKNDENNLIIELEDEKQPKGSKKQNELEDQILDFDDNDDAEFVLEGLDKKPEVSKKQDEKKYSIFTLENIKKKVLPQKKQKQEEPKEIELLEDAKEKDDVELDLLGFDDKGTKPKKSKKQNEHDYKISDLEDMKIEPEEKEPKEIKLLDNNNLEIEMDDENIIPIKKELPKKESKTMTSKIFEFFGFGKFTKKKNVESNLIIELKDEKPEQKGRKKQNELKKDNILDIEEEEIIPVKKKPQKNEVKKKETKEIKLLDNNNLEIEMEDAEFELEGLGEKPKEEKKQGEKEYHIFDLEDVKKEPQKKVPKMTELFDADKLENEIKEETKKKTKGRKS
ncbi:MAG: hypothetical protein ILP08_09140 [Lachnospiraceae bacterium]|nr:hypothetical protein [Lachnospiraceae bacterium]